MSIVPILGNARNVSVWRINKAYDIHFLSLLLGY